MSTQDLLPCPFCGGQPASLYYNAECQVCEIKLPHAEWNTRTKSPRELHLEAALLRFVHVDDADRSGKPLFSTQGQGMDGFSKLANYEYLVKEARKALEEP